MSFQTCRDISFADCDPAGMAFFPSYMRILVTVTEELFEKAGCPWPVLFRERGIGLPTVKLDLQFKAPGFHGDRLDFNVTVRTIGRSSLDLHHQVSVAGVTVWTATQVLVATDLVQRRAVRWPDDIREGLSRFLEGENAPNPAT